MSVYDELRNTLKSLSLADLVGMPRMARQELERRMTALENQRREGEIGLRQLKMRLQEAMEAEVKRADALVEDTEGLKFAEPME